MCDWESENREGRGLDFARNRDLPGWAVVDIGTCGDTDLVIPARYRGEPVTRIAASAFDSCDFMTGITIPDSIRSIDRMAFFNCTGLTDIKLPEGVLQLGSQAFYGCSGLTHITIPAGVKSMGACLFPYCNRLERLVVAKENPVYHSAGNCIIETAGKTLVSVCQNSVLPQDGSILTLGEQVFFGSGINDVFLPDSITAIGKGAFEYNGCLTEITIPNRVTTIGDYAFFLCSELTEVTLGTRVTTVGSCAFRECRRLPRIVLPNGVSEIGSQSFYDCNSLADVTFSRSVAIIGMGAFAGCRQLVDIHFQGTKDEWKKIRKGNRWDRGTGEYTVSCTDGILRKQEA